MSNEKPEGFPQIKARLDDIADCVTDESLSLDDVLKLYEEAVTLGLEASSLLEQEVLSANEDKAETAESSDQAPEA